MLSNYLSIPRPALDRAEPPGNRRWMTALQLRKLHRRRNLRRWVVWPACADGGRKIHQPWGPRPLRPV